MGLFCILKLDSIPLPAMSNTMSKLTPHLALFGANVIYGINYSVAKDVMPDYIQPLGFIFIRAIGALILFWLLGLILKINEVPERKDLIRLFFCGVFGVAVNQMLFFVGLSQTNPINAAIIMTTNPILVLIIASIILKERISWSKTLGIGLGLSGALSLILFKNGFDNLHFSGGTITGDILVFLNATSYGIYLVLVKPIMNKYAPLTVIKYVFLFGFLIVIPFGWNQFTEVSWETMPAKIWGETAFVVIGTTFFAYLLNIFALKKVSPSIVSIYIYSQPLLAGLIAVLLGKDSIDVVKIVATVLIFSGVYLVSKPKKA